MQITVAINKESAEERLSTIYDAIIALAKNAKDEVRESTSQNAAKNQLLKRLVKTAEWINMEIDAANTAEIIKRKKEQQLTEVIPNKE